MAPHSALARLQQRVVLGLVLAAGAWALWQWPRSPVAALSGAVAILFVHALFLGAEFMVLPLVAARDPAPRPSPWQLARSWLGESVMAVRVFGWRQPFRWAAIPDNLPGSARGRRGVVFVHGFVCNRGFWAPWMRELRAANRAFVAVNLEPVFSSIDAYAPIVERAVQQVREATGLEPLLVCHSMGGLAARAWMRGCAPGSAHRVVTIGTPHHGTALARHSHMPNGRQMRRSGSWLRSLAQEEAARGYAAFTCWYSNCDNIVMPPSTATLDGADNRLVPGRAHVELAFDPSVLSGTLALLDTPV